jgi:hypothetical protein
MKKIIHLLLFPLLLFACSSNNKGDGLSDHTLASRGTVVLVFVDKDSIIVAADSRSERVRPNHRSEFSDTTNKIFRIGNVFFTTAGTTVYKNRSVQSIIRKNYNSSESIFKNCEELNKVIASDFQNYFDLLTKEERKYYSADEISNALITVIATGYEKNKPKACKMTIGPTFDSNKISITTKQVNKDSSILHLQFGGYCERIMHYPFAYMPKSKNRMKDIISLIKTEAHYHPVQVDTLVNYAIIKKGGFRVGRNY